jgi:hypothetical protein
LLALAGSSELFGAAFDYLLKFLKPMFEHTKFAFWKQIGSAHICSAYTVLDEIYRHGSKNMSRPSSSDA